MKRFSTSIFCLLSLLFSITAFSQEKVLIWNDEFDGNALKDSLWNIEVNDEGGGNNELQYYTDRPENLQVENGNLVITARKESYQTREYTSARINTKGKGDFRYGRFEASIKLPKGQGIWPAFWLLASENIYGQWPNSGEIDIMELLGHEPDKVYGSIHTGSPYNHETKSYTLQDGDFSQDYHTFAVERKKDTIRYFVDDSLYATYTPETVSPWEPFYEKFHIILNVAVGGNWPGNPDGTTNFPQTMHVDYVRVYSDPAQIAIQKEQPVFPGAGGITFSVPEIEEASYTWSWPEGVTVTADENTHAPKVEWGCDTGTIHLDMTLGDTTYAYNYTVAFDELNIDGPQETYRNATGLAFQAPDMQNVTYNWHLPEGASITGNPDSSAINVDWGCKAGDVVLELETSCKTLTDTLPVAFEEIFIQGPRFVSENAEGVIYSIKKYADVSYNWSVPGDAEIYAGQGSYVIKVDFGTDEGDIVAELTDACGTRTYSLPVEFASARVLCDYESTELEFETFGGAGYKVTENPDPDDLNSTGFVGRFDKSKTAWAGIYADMGYELNLDEMKEARMMVHAPVKGTVKFKLEDNEPGNAEPVEVDASSTKINEWEELTFDISGLPSGTFDRIALFFDFGSQTENTFYFDNILLKGGEDSNSGLGKHNQKGFRVYPNPAKDAVYLQMQSSMRNALISIYSKSGELIRQQRLQDLSPGMKQGFSIAEFAPGIYFMQLQSPAGTKAIPFIKK